MYRQPIRKSQASQAQHYVYIQTKTSTADGEGGVIESWVSGVAKPAAIMPIKALQQFEYKSINIDATHIIKMRARNDISEKSRILWGTRIFEILTIENLQERNFLLLITCKEKR